MLNIEFRMMKSREIFLCIIILAFSFSCNQKKEESNPMLTLNLQTVEHQNFSLQQLANNKASVILFLQPECPFCNSYGKTLKSLDSLFESKHVKTYAVVAGKFYPDSEIVS